MDLGYKYADEYGVAVRRGLVFGGEEPLRRAGRGECFFGMDENIYGLGGTVF